MLKNSLINALLFRSHRAELREVVYRGVEQQAAVGLTRVDVDSAVDRSPIIHLGYGLLALMVVWCAYLFLSPKNPLQTVARVATPWREISRPSKVEVSDVQPGDTTVYRGQTLPISALVNGLDDDQYPVVQFSTADGQIVDRSIRMRPDSRLRFVAELSPTENGIWQDVDYRIVAGDAVTRIYRVTALEAPHILVDRVEYDFPAYTKMPSEVIPGEGDIRALEGTRVTVHGVANQPIKSGHVQLLRPPAADAKPGTESKQAARVAPLQFEERQAHVAFRLALKADRVAPVYSGYRLHFVNSEGVASNQPVEHSIEVIPDLQPVVEVLTPARQSTDVPENAWQRIEIRALDPDFALTKVELRARAKGGTLLQTDLLAEEYVGQAVVTYDFTPREFGLQAGDEVEFWAMAEDNRVAASNGQPQPNRSATEKQYLRIVAADPLAEPTPEEKEPANADSNGNLKKGTLPKGKTANRASLATLANNKRRGRKAGNRNRDPGCNRTGLATANKATLKTVKAGQAKARTVVSRSRGTRVRTPNQTKVTSQAPKTRETHQAKVDRNRSQARPSRDVARKIPTNRFPATAVETARSSNAFATTCDKTKKRNRLARTAALPKTELLKTARLRNLIRANRAEIANRANLPTREVAPRKPNVSRKNPMEAKREATQSLAPNRIQTPRKVKVAKGVRR